MMEGDIAQDWRARARRDDEGNAEYCRVGATPPLPVRTSENPSSISIPTLTPRDVCSGGLRSMRDGSSVQWRLGGGIPFQIALFRPGRAPWRVPGMSFSWGMSFLRLDWDAPWEIVKRSELGETPFPIEVVPISEVPARVRENDTRVVYVVARKELAEDFRPHRLVLGPEEGEWSESEMLLAGQMHQRTGATTFALNYPRLDESEMAEMVGWLAALLRVLDTLWVFLRDEKGEANLSVRLRATLSVECVGLLRRHLALGSYMQFDNIYDDPSPCEEVQLAMGEDELEEDFAVTYRHGSEELHASGRLDATHFTVGSRRQRIKVPYFADVHALRHIDGTWSIHPGRLNETRDGLGRFSIL